MGLDSTLAEPHATLGFVNLYYDWDWEASDREFQRAIALNPSYATAHEWYGFLLTAMGRFDEARAEEQRAQELDPLSIAIAGSAGFMSEGHLLASAGRATEARAILARLDSMSRTQYVTAYGPALVYAQLNQRDSAFAWLDRAYAERTNWMVWLNRDPRWRSVRDDPRFLKIVSQMRLPK